jgi:hypothetical protein
MSNRATAQELHAALETEIERKGLDREIVKSMLTMGGFPDFKIFLNPELEDANVLVGRIVDAEARERRPQKKSA